MVEPKPMISELTKRSTNRDGPAITISRLRAIFSYQVLGGGSLAMKSCGLMRLHREQIDKSLQRRLEEHLRRIGDRVRLRLEGGRADPDQRQDRDDGVDDDDRAGQPADERRRLGERTWSRAALIVASLC